MWPTSPLFSRMVCHPIGLHLQSTGSKRKLFKISRVERAKYQSKRRPSAPRTLCDCTGHFPLTKWDGLLACSLEHTRIFFKFLILDIQEGEKWSSPVWHLWHRSEILFGPKEPVFHVLWRLWALIWSPKHQFFFFSLSLFPRARAHLMQISANVKARSTNNIKKCRTSDVFGINCLHFSTPSWTKS